MLPDRLDYSPILDRPVIRWPNNARIAFWVSPNVMFYEYMPPPSLLSDPFAGRGYPNVRFYSHEDFGNRVGFWRMFDVLQKHQMPCTAALNVAVLQHLPEIRKAMVDAGWNYMAHGIYNTRYLWGLTEAEERGYYQDILDTVYEFTGKRVKGTMGPGPQSNNAHTPDVLAEMGFLYTGDWFHDDQPFPLKVRSGRLISVPYTHEVTDGSVLSGVSAGTGGEARDFADLVKRQFDRLYQEGATSGRVMCISLHAYLVAQPHRIKYLDEVLGYILSHDGVWKTTAEDIAEYYLANCYDAVQAHVAQQKALGLVK